MKGIVNFFDRVFEVLAHGVVSKRRRVFLPPVIILACIVLVKVAVDPIGRVVAANVDFAVTREDTPVTINVLSNDKDMNSGQLKVTGVVQGTKGSVRINKDNTVTYTPGTHFSGIDVFSYTVSNDKGAKDTASVQVTVTPVNNPPVIFSRPVTVATRGKKYTYDVDGTDPDAGDKLTYSLVKSPDGMTINPASGLIEWTPSDVNVGSYDVVVKVADSAGATNTQSFSIIVGEPGLPHKVVLTVVDVYDQADVTKLLEADRAKIVQASDNQRWKTGSGAYACYDFSDVTIPADAVITSAVVQVEHFEEGTFAEGALQWCVGTGWPNKPEVWSSAGMPVRGGSEREGTDVWDITSLVDTLQKLNSLQLLIKNDNAGQADAFVDYVCVVVEWKQGQALLKKQ